MAMDGKVDLNNNHTDSTETLTIIQLPPEILLYILKFLKLRDIKSIASTCKTLREVAHIPSLYRGCIFRLIISKNTKYNLSPRKVQFINRMKITKISVVASFFEFARDPSNRERRYDELMAANVQFNIPLMNMTGTHLAEMSVDQYMDLEKLTEFISGCTNIKSLEMDFDQVLETISDDSRDTWKLIKVLDQVENFHLNVGGDLHESAYEMILGKLTKLSSIRFETDNKIDLELRESESWCLVSGYYRLPCASLWNLHDKFGTEFKFRDQPNCNLTGFMAEFLKSGGDRDFKWPPYSTGQDDVKEQGDR